jgi:Flp pilus assembly protein TadG
MRKLTPGPDPRGEEGVTLVIVTLCLVALFGMLVLVVDVGGLLLNRREMVNAADAGALSAAKSCVLPTSKDSYATPEDAADAYAAQNSKRVNIADPGNLIQNVGCDTGGNGYVTARYTAPQHFFFAPVLGAGSDGQVTTQATAIFGPAGTASPLPIVLYRESFNTCKLNQKIDPANTCYVWEDNSNVSGAQFAFGLLDLRTDDPSKYGWDSVPGADCNNAGNDPDQAIKNYQSGSAAELNINYPDPTYVCSLSGMQQNAWADLEQLRDDDDTVDNNDEEDILYFPINRCDAVVPGDLGGQISRTSNSSWQEVPCSDTPTQFDIIGFAAMKLVDIYDRNSATGATGICESDVQILQGAENLLTFDIGSLTANGGRSCPTGQPDQISSGPTMTRVTNGNGGGPEPTQCLSVPAANCDYSYSDGVITWSRSGPAQEGQNFRIAFSWANAGPCGVPPPNNSGHCLVLLPVDVKIGRGCPGCGFPGSNVQAYKLCDPTIEGSCDPIKVQAPPGS